MSARVSGDLEYACARVGARYGARPDEAAWRRIETVRELAAMLETARATALRPWTAGLSADSDAHTIERVLRGHWRALAAEVATWMPQHWRPCVEWTAIVPDLPALDRLREGRLPPTWLDEPIHERDAAAAPLAALADAHDADTLVAVWRDEWRRRLPAGWRREAPMLAKLGQAIARYRAAMRAAAPGDGTAIIHALRERLEALYRHATLEPTASFAFLALAALDLARLRGEVVRRSLFPRLLPAQ